MNESELHEIVRANVEGDRRVSVPKPGTPLTMCPTSLDANEPIERAWLFNGCSPGDYECTPDKPLRMRVCHFLIIPENLVDEETGEVSEFPRVVLYDRDGKTFRTCGVAAPHQVKRLWELYGSNLWREGIPLLIQCRPSKRHKGSTYHDIRVDVDALFGE